MFDSRGIESRIRGSEERNPANSRCCGQAGIFRMLHGVGVQFFGNRSNFQWSADLLYLPSTFTTSSSHRRLRIWGNEND